MLKGPLLALVSAALFGVSPALAKLVLGEMSSVLMAGLLYLGSGVGLLGWEFLHGRSVFASLAASSRVQRFQLLGAIVTGGVFAPVCLISGLRSASGIEASLLLNLEAVATTVLAWAFFREHVSREVWFGKVLVIAGAVVLTLHAENGTWTFSSAGLWIAAACVFWAVDNNLTRDIEALSATELAGIKGGISGLLNLALALTLGAGHVGFGAVAGSLLIGAVSYGLSLVLFVGALREIGAARTSSYFAAGPFFGMLLSILVLHEMPGLPEGIAAGLMLLGVGVLVSETHAHEHTHHPLTHSHPHIHDEHHVHAHFGDEGDEPHDHTHTHTELTHIHPHWPDLHHRHSH